jgi:hypothetical protein
MIIPVLKMIKPKFSVLLTFSCLFQNVGDIETHLIVVYLTSLCVNWTFFGTRGPF